MSAYDREMRKALQADAEKLEQLTGEPQPFHVDEGFFDIQSPPSPSGAALASCKYATTDLMPCVAKQGEDACDEDGRCYGCYRRGVPFPAKTKANP